MNSDTLPSDSDSDSARALALVIADGAAAQAMAAEVLQQRPGADAGERALAHSVCALHALREGDLADCRRHLDATTALGDASAIGPRAADVLQHVQAQVLRRDGHLARSEALLHALHERASTRPLVDAYLTASALGTVRSMQGRDDDALNIFYQALSLARRSGELSLVVNALNNLGSYQSDLSNLEDAAPLLEECLAGACRLGSHRQIIYAAGNLVQCLCHLGQVERALALAREHLIGRIRPDDGPALQRDEEIAQVLLDNGLVDEAAAMLGGERHVDPLSNELATAHVWLLARIRLATGRSDEALALCLARRSRIGAEGEESTPALDRVNLLRVAAQAANGIGDHALGYRLLEEAFAVHEQLLGRAARSRQISLQIAHGLRQAEWERDAAQQMAGRLEALNVSLQAQIDENERLQQRLRAQALEDPLTGAYNRRHLLDAGAALLAAARRRAEPLSAVVVDMDHFKAINDRHGHDAGDRVLRAFSDLARQHVRAEDLLCRYGGEEFVLLLAGAQASQAATRLGHLLQMFTALRFDGAGGETFDCSFSAGVATTAGRDGTLTALLARADAALYAAKDAGRACVHVATPAGE